MTTEQAHAQAEAELRARLCATGRHEAGCPHRPLAPAIRLMLEGRSYARDKTGWCCEAHASNTATTIGHR